MIGMETSIERAKAPKKSQVLVTEKDPEVSEVDFGDEEMESGDAEENSSDAESEASASNDEQLKTNANPGWADVLRKILNTNKPRRKKTIVLSKAKKLAEVKVLKAPDTVAFEIETQNGKIIKEAVPKVEETEEIISLKRKHRVAQGIRVKPSLMDRERERALQRIATKGVVQLFNVVKQQQAEINRKLIEVGPTERKREKVLKSIDKRAFLDVLMGGSKSIPVTDTTKHEKSSKNEDDKPDKVWSVLRDDFVMGAKLKDWDKKAPEEDDDSTSSEEMDSD